MSSQAVSRCCPSICQGVFQKIQTVGTTCKKVALYVFHFFRYSLMDFLKVPFYGWSRVFHDACAKDHLITVSLFLKRVNINQKDRYGHTPLVTACIHKNLEIVQFLIENKADVKQVFKDTFPRNACPLVRHMDLETLQQIDAELMEASDNKTSLMAELAYDFDPDLVGDLIEKGLNPELLFNELLVQANQVDSEVARGLAQTGFCSYRAYKKFLAVAKIIDTFDQAISIYEKTTGKSINDLRLKNEDPLFVSAVQTGCVELVEYLLSREDIEPDIAKSIDLASNNSFTDIADSANIVKLLKAKAEEREIPSIREENEKYFKRLVGEKAYQRTQDHLKEMTTILL